MHKRLAIVGLLALAGIAAGQQTPAGTPKQSISVQEPSHKGQEQPQTQGNNNSAPDPVPPAPKPTTPTANQSGQNGTQGSEINRWLMYFTGALVVVGVLQFGGMIWQAVLLRETRKDVGRQADWIEAQAGHMSSQVEEMKLQRSQTVEEMRRQAYQMGEQAAAGHRAARAASESARAALSQIKMMKQKERARLSVTKPYEIKSLDAGVFGLNFVTLGIENLGYTNAYNVSVQGEADMTYDGSLAELKNLSPVDAPNVIKGESGVQTIEFVFVSDWDRMKDIPKGKFAWIHVKGFARYDDVFGESHITGFRFAMKVDRFPILEVVDQGIPITSYEGWQVSTIDNQVT
jgi:hypothetical protein